MMTDNAQSLVTFVRMFAPSDSDDMLIYRRAGDGVGLSLGDLREAADRIDRLEAALRETTNELHCCDDVPLDKGLAFGIASLRGARDEASAWRPEAMAYRVDAQNTTHALRQAKTAYIVGDYPRVFAIIDAALTAHPKEPT